jgi:ABC-2 type transport system permease protein
MNPAFLWSTTRRVIDQLVHDTRSMALVLVVPSVLLAMMYFLFKEPLAPGLPSAFNRIGLVLLGIFPFVMMFLVTSIAMLRERTSGTLERLMTTPINKADLLFGYGLAYSLIATLQAVVTSAVAYGLLGLETQGSPVLVILVAVIDAILGVALGLASSAFARTEFQAMQFMPVFIMPQILVCGLFVPRERMAGWLQALAKIFPVTYAVDALKEIGANTGTTATMWRDLGIVAIFAVAALLLASATLQRRSD